VKQAANSRRILTRFLDLSQEQSHRRPLVIVSAVELARDLASLLG